MKIKNNYIIVRNNNGSSSLASVFFLQVTGSSNRTAVSKNLFLSTVMVPCGRDGFEWQVAPSGTSFLFDAVLFSLVTRFDSPSGLLFSWGPANFKLSFGFDCTNSCFSLIETEFSLESVSILFLNELENQARYARLLF